MPARSYRNPAIRSSDDGVALQFELVGEHNSTESIIIDDEHDAGLSNHYGTFFLL
jgi:hypothetical protein